MKRYGAVLGVCAVVVMAGCDRPEPRAYTVPKEERVIQGSIREQLAASQERPTAPAQFEPGETPGNWSAERPGQFSFATYRIAGEGDAEAQLTVTAFPGSAGGLLANINRWRGQLGLEAATSENLELSNRQIGEIPFRLVMLEGVSARSGQPEAIFGAIAETGGKSWFFKVMGAPTVVKESEASLMKFIETSRIP